MSFEHKYLKYKQKYLELKNELIKSQNGGNLIDFENSTESLDIERLTETPSFKKAFGLNKNNYSKILEKDISLEKILQNGGDGREIDTDSDDLPDKLETVTDVHEDHHNEPGYDGAGEPPVHDEPEHDGAGEPPVHDNEPGHDGTGEPGHDGVGEYNATDTANETQVDLDKMLQVVEEAVEPYDHNEVFTLNAVSSRSQLGGFLNMKGGEFIITSPAIYNEPVVQEEVVEEPVEEQVVQEVTVSGINAYDPTPHSTASPQTGGNEDLDTSISELDEIFSQLGGKKKSSDKDSIEEFLAEEESESSDELLSELDSSSSSDFL